MAKSLLEGLDVEKKSAAKKGGGGGGSAKTKTYVAVGLLAVAVGVLVWYYGLRGNGAPPIEPVDQAQVQQQQQQAQRAVQEAQSKGATVTGND
jgi:predicted metalloprotease